MRNEAAGEHSEARRASGSGSGAATRGGSHHPVMIDRRYGDVENSRALAETPYLERDLPVC